MFEVFKNFSKQMDTLDGMPLTTAPPRPIGRMAPTRVEPLTALQKEFNAISSALTAEPTPEGIELAQLHLTSLERNLEVALSMYPTNGSNGNRVPDLQVDGKYIDPTIAELFRLRCREVIAKKHNSENDEIAREMLRALQEKVQEATINVLDAMGIMEELDDYRETLQQAIEGRFEHNFEKLTETIGNARRFIERVNGCEILPMDYKINIGLLGVQLAQLEEMHGLLF